MLVVTELVVGRTQCNLWWRELCSLQPGARYNETRSKRDPVLLVQSCRKKFPIRSDRCCCRHADVMMYSPCVAINYYHYAVNKFTIVTFVVVDIVVALVESNFCSASALSFIDHNGKNWMKRRKWNQNLLLTSTIRYFFFASLPDPGGGASQQTGIRIRAFNTITVFYFTEYIRLVRMSLSTILFWTHAKSV